MLMLEMPSLPQQDWLFVLSELCSLTARWALGTLGIYDSHHMLLLSVRNSCLLLCLPAQLSDSITAIPLVLAYPQIL